MLTNRDVILIASVDWQPLWQSHQEVATRLAAAGNRVLYVENTGVRWPRLADASRVRKRLDDWAHESHGAAARSVAPNLHVYSPLVLPPLGPRGARVVNRRILLPSVAKVASSLGLRDTILWTWLPTDTALDLAELLDPRLLVYMCIADFERLAARPGLLRKNEIELLRRSDLVFAQSSAISARCEPYNGNVHVLPPSVDLELFDPVRVPPTPSDPPLIGYVGGLHSVLDVELLQACAKLRPDWRWRFVGPHQRSVEALAQIDNVELTGPRDHNQIPREIARFSVGIVPYLNQAETEMVTPTKIVEYLAMGCPVVATGLPWVEAFQADYGVIELAAPDPERFIEAIERALVNAHDAAARARRRAVARTFGWAAAMTSASATIETMLADQPLPSERQA